MPSTRVVSLQVLGLLLGLLVLEEETMRAGGSVSSPR